LPSQLGDWFEGNYSSSRTNKVHEGLRMDSLVSSDVEDGITWTHKSGETPLEDPFVILLDAEPISQEDQALGKAIYGWAIDHARPIVHDKLPPGLL